MRSKRAPQERAVWARYGALLKPAPWGATAAGAARLEALEGASPGTGHEQALRRGAPEAGQNSLENRRACLEEEKRRLEREIEDPLPRHPELQGDQDLRESIPAVDPKTARKRLA